MRPWNCSGNGLLLGGGPEREGVHIRQIIRYIIYEKLQMFSSFRTLKIANELYPSHAAELLM
jgi:hypothetical protein